METMLGTDPHWTIERIAGQYEWHVQVGSDTAKGESTTEADALRDIAWALDWLQGGTARQLLKATQ